MITQHNFLSSEMIKIYIYIYINALYKQSVILGRAPVCNFTAFNVYFSDENMKRKVIIKMIAPTLHAQLLPGSTLTQCHSVHTGLQ